MQTKNSATVRDSDNWTCLARFILNFIVYPLALTWGREGQEWDGECGVSNSDGSRRRMIGTITSVLNFLVLVLYCSTVVQTYITFLPSYSTVVLVL